MPGHMRFSFEANPSFFDSLRIHGYKNTVIVAKDESNKVLGFGVRSIQKLFIEEKLSDVGYLSMLRIDKKHRGKGILHNGMHFLKDLDQKDNNTSFYFSFIVNNNKLAKKIFLSKKEGFPTFYNMGNISTYIIFLDKDFFRSKIKPNERLLDKYTIKRASDKDADAIIKFVNNYGSKRNFFPSISKKDILTLSKTFFLAYKNKELSGIVSVWNQSEVRQTIVRGYSLPMQVYTTMFNLYAKYSSKKPFPKVNKPFNYVYLSDILVKDDNSDLFNALLKHVLTEYTDQKYDKYHCCVFSMHEKDGLNEVLDNYKKISYNSTMYLSSWKNQDKLFNTLKNRSIYVDIARA
jgi:hypothetical protein